MESPTGRMKNFAVAKATLPLSMARITDQIVTVCALLVNFKPALIPPFSCDLSGVDYFAILSESGSN